MQTGGFRKMGLWFVETVPPTSSAPWPQSCCLAHPKQHLALFRGIWQCHKPLEQASMAERASWCYWLNLGNGWETEKCSSVAQCWVWVSDYKCSWVFSSLPRVDGWTPDTSLSKGLACWTHGDAVRFSSGCFAPAWGQSETSYCWNMIWSDGVNLVN